MPNAKATSKNQFRAKMAHIKADKLARNRALAVRLGRQIEARAVRDDVFRPLTSDEVVNGRPVSGVRRRS